MNTERLLRWGDALAHRCAPVLARATAKTCALAFACAGERRVVAWWLQLLRKAARPGAVDPAFRLTSELVAAGIPPETLQRVLDDLGRHPHKRRVAFLSTVTGIAAGALVRRQAAARRHLSHPESAPPPVRDFILATTVRCNLHCVGCYTQTERTGREPSDAMIDAVLRQGKRLGLARVHMVGKGEPFLDEDTAARTIGIVERHRDLAFDIFTNGVEMTEAMWKRLARCANVVVMVSVNGLRETNDRSRGRGVFDAVMRAFAQAETHGVIHGFSTTVTSENYEEVTSPPFLAAMESAGNSYGLFFKYSVMDAKAPARLALNPVQTRDYEGRLRAAAESSRMLLADPDVFERGMGCRARSGALVYVDLITGRVSPCVKTPFSPNDSNLFEGFHDDRMAELLSSDFFRRYRAGFARGVTCSSHGTTEHEWFLSDRSLHAAAHAQAARDAASRGIRVSLPVVP